MYLCDQQRLRPACADAQSDQSLGLSLEYSLSVKLLTEHHLDLLSLKGGCTSSSWSTLVKMPHCWKSRVTAQFLFQARPTTFNRGILANVGFLAAQSTGLYNCYVIHDVDLFPLNDRNTYSCSNQFRHLSIENSKYKKG